MYVIQGTIFRLSMDISMLLSSENSILFVERKKKKKKKRKRVQCSAKENKENK